jgi:hypothetical protein
LIPGHSEPVGAAGPGGTDFGSTYYFQKPYPDTETSVIPVNCNWPIRFLGTGSTVLSLLEDESGSGFSDFFEVTTEGSGDNTGGMTFEDLYFTYPPITGTLTTAAIHIPAEGAENVRVVRCAFVDCPNGIILEDGLQASIMQCTFQYQNNVGTEVGPVFWTRNRRSLCDDSANHAASSVGLVQYTAFGVRPSSDECGRCSL